LPDAVLLRSAILQAARPTVLHRFEHAIISPQSADP